MKRTTKKSKRLELVDKFINYFPQPLVRKLQNNWTFSTCSKMVYEGYGQTSKN